jgi:membrane dipeptidase
MTADHHTLRARSMAAHVSLIATLLVAGCGGGDAPDDAAAAPAASAIDADALHARVLTVDTHDDIPFNFATDDVDPLNADRQVNLEKMEAGGLDVGFFIVYVGQTERTPENYARAQEQAMTKFDAIHRMTDTYPDRIELAHTADDVERIAASGKLVAAIGIENGYVIGRDLALLERYHELGARYITLAHGGHNDIADSATPRENLGDDPDGQHGGVSAFGEEVIAEMNRLGILVDVSHISRAAMLDAVRLSRAPVIASHSSTTAVADHPRNLDDEQLRAIRDNGGVAHMVALDGYVKVQPPERGEAVAALRQDVGIESFRDLQTLSDSARARYDEGMAEIDRRWPPASVSDFVDHIDHAVEVAGIDHVGISSDFDGGGGIVGWADASETANLTRELVRRGYTEGEIAKLWSGNLLRIWREAERVAAALQAGG